MPVQYADLNTKGSVKMYRITVSKLEPCQKENSYNKYDAETIFEQVLDEIDLWEIITAVNFPTSVAGHWFRSREVYPKVCVDRAFYSTL